MDRRFIGAVSSSRLMGAVGLTMVTLDRFFDMAYAYLRGVKRRSVIQERLVVEESSVKRAR